MWGMVRRCLSLLWKAQGQSVDGINAHKGWIKCRNSDGNTDDFVQSNPDSRIPFDMSSFNDETPAFPWEFIGTLSIWRTAGIRY